MASRVNSPDAGQAILETIQKVDYLLVQIGRETGESQLQNLYNRVEPLLQELEPVLLDGRDLTEIPTRPLVAIYLSDHLNSPSELDIRLKIWGQYLRDLRVSPAGPPDPEAEQDPIKHYGSLYRVGSAVRQYAIYRELLRRIEENENRNGRVVRDFLVNRRDGDGNEQMQFLKRLRKLLFHRTSGLRLPGDRKDGDRKDEEKRAIADEKVFQGLSEFWSMPVTALDPDGLEALVEGRFNKTAWEIRDRFRDELKRELRISERKEVHPEPDVDLIDLVAISEPDTPLTEARIILELVASYLTQRQRQFLEIRLKSSSDKEAAQKMGITPSAASQLFSQIRKRAAALAD